MSNEAFRIERIEIGRADQPESRPLLDLCHAIRRTVFVDEQSVPSDMEWDGFDDAAEHFLIFAGVGAAAPALGTARLRLFETYAKAERVAVLPRSRGQGLGRALMTALEASALRRGRDRIELSAQVSALPFYETLGYVAHGEVFMEAGIEHRAMTKRMAPSPR